LAVEDRPVAVLGEKDKTFRCCIAKRNPSVAGAEVINETQEQQRNDKNDDDQKDLFHV